MSKGWRDWWRDWWWDFGIGDDVVDPLSSNDLGTGDVFSTDFWTGDVFGNDHDLPFPS